MFTYLPTRTFELAVHSLDIAGALGISLELPDDVLADALALASRITVASGRGSAVLLALTGRAGLPPSSLSSDFANLSVGGDYITAVPMN